MTQQGSPTLSSLKTLSILLLRILVSGIFLIAGVLKLRDADATLVAVFQYKLLSWEASGLVATLLPFVEITAALGLWIPRLRLGATALCIALNCLFLLALGSAIARNLDVTCGCFGTADLHTNALPRFVEDIVLLLFCVPLWSDTVRKSRAQLQSGARAGK